jgi:hypothetical protein
MKNALTATTGRRACSATLARWEWG